MPVFEHGKPQNAAGQRPKELILAKDARLTAAVTPDQWAKLLGLIATGVQRGNAIEALGIDKTALEGWLRAEPLKYRAWREAIISADRLGWSAESIEGICFEIANKAKLKDACGKYGKSVQAFLLIVWRDPTIKEMYEEARTLAAELEADDLREISDDDGNDMTIDGKGNTASVNRSKLRVETRLRLMAAFNRKRFAEQRGGEAAATSVTVNINHADRLESARGRLTRVIEGEAIEVLEQRGTNALIPAEDTTWLD